MVYLCTMIFKKQICVVITFFLLLSQTGLAFNIHFCDSKIASVGLYSKATAYQSEKNCCGEVEKESKCCHNSIVKSIEKPETIFVKTLTFAQNYFPTTAQWSPILLKPLVKGVVKNNATYYCDSNAPPIFKLNCQLVFYA